MSVTYLHSDHLGSTSKTTGAASSAQLYEAYGAKRGASEVDTPYRYTGQRWEENDALDIYYYKARWYDPALGRFLQPDTIAPGGGEGINTALVVDYHDPKILEQLNKQNHKHSQEPEAEPPEVPTNPQALNRYAYGYDNPLKNTDPDGHIAFLVPVVTGLIGGVAGGTGAIIAQMVSAEGSSFADRWGQVDWGDVAIAAGVGAVAGAAAPFIAVSALGAAALGAGANVAQYSLTQLSNDEKIEGTALLTNAVVGGVTGGLIVGATPLVDTSTTLMFDATSPWLDQALARSINTSLELAPIISAENMVRSSAGGVVSNWPWTDVAGW